MKKPLYLKEAEEKIKIVQEPVAKAILTELLKREPQTFAEIAKAVMKKQIICIKCGQKITSKELMAYVLGEWVHVDKCKKGGQQ